MQKLNELSVILKQSFNWNKARLDCFTGMLIGLLKTRSVNLNEIALGFPSTVKLDSRYRRVQRFIHSCSIDFDEVATFIMFLFAFITDDYYLALDRSNWKLGKKNINFLVLAVVYKGIAIPVYWSVFGKRGNSNTKERIALMQKFIEKFGNKNLLGLLGDREFIGEKWLKWLKSEEIEFYIRIKKDAKIPNSQGVLMQAHCLFRFLKVGESLVIRQSRMMTKNSIYLSALRLDNGELLIIVTSKISENAIKIYAKRWVVKRFSVV